MTTVFIDIETVSTTREDYRDRVSETISHPGNMKKPETIAKWEEEEKPKAIDEEVEKTVFNGGLCHVVQVNLGIDDGESLVFQAESEAKESELLRAVFAVAGIDFGTGIFVGHNVHAFDLQILRQRAIVLGIELPASIRKASKAKPWDNYVFDTMTEWAGYGQRVSMDNLCYYLGVDTPKSEIDGSTFGQFYRAGELEKCRQYGKDEIEALRQVYDRLTAI